MKEFLNKIIIRNQEYLLKKGISKDNKLAYLKERIFLESLQIVLVVSILAYIPSVTASIVNGLWLFGSVNTLAMLTFISMIVFNKIPINIRINTILGVLYFFGLFLLIFDGPYRAGLIWLIGFSIIATIFFGLKAGYVTSLINLMTFIILGICIKLSLFNTPLFTEYSIASWISATTSLLVVNVVSIFSLGRLLQGLQDALETEQKLKQKLKRKSERLILAKVKAEESELIKTAFLNNISHEFRTPMNSIMGFTELILHNDIDKKLIKQYLQNIHKSSEKLLQIIHNTIEYSQIEMGIIDLHPNEFDIANFLILLHEELEMKCPEQLIFEVKVNNSKIKMIKTDAEKLKQIFTNLILNAFKFTEKGTIKFGIMESAYDNFIQFFVSDTGIGIERSKQKDIFTSFYKENDFKHGTGLGLSISATLITHLGGRIWLDSELNKGTTFYFLLPPKLKS